MDVIKTEVSQSCKRQRYLRKRNDELTDKVADLERRVERFEMQDVVKAKAGIIIHGVDEPEDETDPALLERIRNKLGKQLNIEPAAMKYATRLRPSKISQEKAKEKNEKAIGPVLLKFYSIREKFSSFKNIKNMANDDETKSWRISQEIPSCLKKRNAKLMEMAQKLRGKKDGMRTKIIWRGLNLELHSKGPNDTGFAKVDI